MPQTKKPTPPQSKPQRGTIFDENAPLVVDDDEMKTDPKRNQSVKTAAFQFQGWNEKRAAILKKYTTNQEVAVSAEFLEGTRQEAETEEQKRKQRVDALDDQKQEEDQFVSQKELIRKLEQQNQRIAKAWTTEKRVLALKLAIQAAKELGKNKVPQFYPSMYVLVADILDTFGDLVFERLRQKANSPNPIRQNFTKVDVGDDARETCYNWFYKIACIRELLPRLLIELSLFRCWRFLKDPQDFLDVLHRVHRTIRGIGDPLVAAFVRAYMVKKGRELCRDVEITDWKEILLEGFDDFMKAITHEQKQEWKYTKTVTSGMMEVGPYIDLFDPAIDWLFLNLRDCSGTEEAKKMMTTYREGWNNTVILSNLIQHLDKGYVASNALEYCQLIKKADEAGLKKSMCYKHLALVIVEIAPPEDDRLQVLNGIWKYVKKIEDPTEYVEVASVLGEFLLQHFTIFEVDVLLKDLIKHLKKDNSFKKLQEPMRHLVNRSMHYIKDYNDLFSLKNFLPLVDLLDKVPKMEVCKTILSNFQKNHVESKISDPVLIHSLFDVSRQLHDSVDLMSESDLREHVTDLIITFVQRLDFGRDLEKFLDHYVQCRHAFSNLPGVIHQLVLKVCGLAMKALQLKKGVHNKKTAGFVKACLAYCHITIPSLESVFPKMHLFVLSAQVALNNQMTMQAEAFIKGAMKLIPDLPETFTVGGKSRELVSTLLVEYVGNFCGVLLCIPGHPDHGPFYLVRGLQKSLERWKPWENDNSADKARVLLKILGLCCAYWQDRFLYRVEGVDSNDLLYGGTKEYRVELIELINDAMNEVMNIIAAMGKDTKSIIKQKQYSSLVLQFMEVMITNFELNAQVASRTFKCYKFVAENKYTNQRHIKRITSYLRSNSSRGTLYVEVASKIETHQRKLEEIAAKAKAERDAEIAKKKAEEKAKKAERKARKKQKKGFKLGDNK